MGSFGITSIGWSADYAAAGMEPGEARRRARFDFGGFEQIKEDCRDIRGRWLEDLGKDLRYAARERCAAAPSFSPWQYFRSDLASARTLRPFSV